MRILFDDAAIRIADLTRSACAWAPTVEAFSWPREALSIRHLQLAR